MAAFTQVQSTARSSGDNTFNIAFSSIPTAGNALFLLLAWVANGSNNVDVDVTDDTSGALTWHTAVTSANEFGARTKIVYAYDIPSLSAAPTVTITRQGAVTTHLHGSGEEWSGFGTNDPISATTSRVKGATTNHDTNTSGSTAELDALIFSVIQEATITSGLTVETVTPAWTQLWEATAPNTNGRGEADYKLVTTTGTQICRWTSGSATNSSASLAAFVSGLVATTGERINQASRSVVSTLTTTIERTNQTVRSLLSQAAPVIKLNQVVLTLLVLPDTDVPSANLSSRRGIYVPTRGIAGSEGGGGQTPFSALNGRLIVVPPQKRTIYVPPTLMSEGDRVIVVPVGQKRTVYVPPHAEGDISNGARTIVVPKGAEGYTHR